MRSCLRFLFLLSCLLTGTAGLRAAGEQPKMKFNEVKEVAPGVFFRYSAIGPEGSNVPFGGSNNIWVVFEDYVVVIDANFPKEAGDVIEAIKKTTDKPIRYVLDTHHHGDHAYGNAVFGKAGAGIVAQTHCAQLLRLSGEDFKKAGEGPMGRKDIAASTLKVPNLVFDDKLVLDDGKQRVELLFLGHAHTSGDAFAYLPKYKILCTGDACVNGSYNFMGHSDSASWIHVMERAQQLDIDLICPGHGPLAGKELLEKQKRYFVELRQQVQKGIDAGKNRDEILKGMDMPWYKEWTGVSVTLKKDNVDFVYDELTGATRPWDLTEEYGIYEGPSPTKKDSDWKAPRRIVVPNLMPARLAELKRLAPEIEFIPVKTDADAAKSVEDADAVLGFCTPEILKAGKNLRWIQIGHAGVEKYLFPELAASKVAVTNTARIYGPAVADQAFALLLALTRGTQRDVRLNDGDPDGVRQARWEQLRKEMKPLELNGKTMLIVGLGGVGTQIGRRANAFGMRVQAIDPKEMVRPDFVFSLDKPAKLRELLPQADVVMVACPLTAETHGLFGEKELAALKPTAYLVNIARGGVVQTPALVAALQKKQLAGAGLDVTDPEPLPADHPLTKMSNVVISPHIGGQSPDSAERQWRLYRENIRRFVAGEPLVCVVDKAKGY
jgi:cyclase